MRRREARQLTLFRALPVARRPRRPTRNEFFLEAVQRRPVRLQVALNVHGVAFFWTTGDRRLARFWARHVWRLNDWAFYVAQLDFDGGIVSKSQLAVTLKRVWTAEVERARRVDQVELAVVWNRMPVAATHLVLRDYREDLTTVIERDHDGSLIGMVELRRGPLYEKAIAAWMAEASKKGLFISDERAISEWAGASSRIDGGEHLTLVKT